MFTDIEDYTKKTATLPGKAMLKILKEYKSLISDTVKKFKGNIIEQIGDAFVVTYDSPTDAVLSGMSIQNTIRYYNKEQIDQTKCFNMRIGIDTGDVMFERKKIIGNAVNIASRVQNLAEIDEVYFTESTCLLMNKGEIPVTDLGYYHLKNIPNKVKIYKASRHPANSGVFRLNIPGLDDLILTTSQKTEYGYSAAISHEGISTGKRGIAMTDLRPVGKAKFGEKTIEVASETGYIRKTTKVEVIEIRDNTILVRPV